MNLRGSVTTGKKKRPAKRGKSDKKTTEKGHI